MKNIKQTGLGELLRHLTEVLDQESEESYSTMGISYRARYTPVMRALSNAPVSVSEIEEHARITQGAISQTIKLMEADGLVNRVATDDGRSRAVQLTRKGAKLQKSLVELWQFRLDAILDIEDEIGYPLRSILERAINALEDDGLAQRIERRVSRKAKVTD